ncbi:hypothetical protein BDA99DRAFT_566743 [Phascolomyces articulosus]|uniref:Uncharacterized protein n=1 Tax=Phascolomyces articulosus TaxID=60185 RepID=A0AAD5JL99_9FUNG|nr:hypothetical protein BDA99DRAFT_566743 [Phascolomyces articulosus]
MPTASVSSPPTPSPVPSSSGQAAPSFPHVLSRQESVMSNGTTTSLDERFEALTSRADENEEAIDEIKTSSPVTSMERELEQDAEVANMKKQQMAEEDRGKMAGETFADGRDVGKYTEYQDGALVMTIDHMSDKDTTDDEAKMMTREKKGFNVKKPVWHSKHAIALQPSVTSSSTPTSSTPSSSVSSLLPAPSSPVPSPSNLSSSLSLLATLRHSF